MTIDKLHADLERLREEIAASDPADRESLARLSALADEIQTELAQENAIGDPEGLIEELEASVSGFEARHPNLSALVNNLIVLLGGMGV